MPLCHCKWLTGKFSVADALMSDVLRLVAVLTVWQSIPPASRRLGPVNTRSNAMALKRKVNPERVDADNPEWTRADFARARPAAETLPRSLLRKVRGAEAIRSAGVKHTGEYNLRLCWANGKTMVVDLSDLVRRLKGLRTLRDQAVFTRAAKGEGGHSVVWPGKIATGTDRLWEISLEQNGHLDAVEFIR